MLVDVVWIVVEIVAAQCLLLIGLDFDGVLVLIVEWLGDVRALFGMLDVVCDFVMVFDVIVVFVLGWVCDDLFELTLFDFYGDVFVIGSYGVECF